MRDYIIELLQRKALQTLGTLPAQVQTADRESQQLAGEYSGALSS